MTSLNVTEDPTIRAAKIFTTVSVFQTSLARSGRAGRAVQELTHAAATRLRQTTASRCRSAAHTASKTSQPAPRLRRARRKAESGPSRLTKDKVDRCVTSEKIIEFQQECRPLRAHGPEPPGDATTTVTSRGHSR